MVELNTSPTITLLLFRLLTTTTHHHPLLQRQTGLLEDIMGMGNGCLFTLWTHQQLLKDQ
jgi:hypothetical protein